MKRGTFAAAAAVALLAGCTGSGGGISVPNPSSRPGSSSAPSDGATATYGHTLTIKSGYGTVAYSVSAPEVITYHEADCCTDDGDAKKGRPQSPMLRFVVHARGISGVVDVSELELVYQQRDGVLKQETLPPLVTYEKVDALTEHPTQLRAGQATSGEVFVDSTDLRGKVELVLGAGHLAAIWTPAA